MFKYSLAIVLMATMLSACGQRSIRPGSSLQVDAKSSVLVFGMQPNSRIHLIRGDIVDGVWERPFNDTPDVNAFPDEDGYIVVKLRATKATEKLAVSLVFPDGKPYGPCDGNQSPTFTLLPGKITYAGDLKYRVDGAKLSFSISSDVEKAHAYVASRFQEVGSFEFHPMEVMKVLNGPCGPKTMIIPIYLPRGR